MESLEDLIVATGDFGRFQLSMVLFTSLPVFIAGWTIMQVQFIDLDPQFYCVIDKWQNDSTRYGQTSNITSLNSCSVNGTSCDAYVYVNSWVTTVTKWDLVCDRKWIKKFLESLQLAGLFLGSLLAGQVSDWYGRKKAYLGCVVLTSLSNLFAALSFNWELFGVMRIFLGIGCGGIMALYVPYSVEFLSIKWRSAAVLFPGFSVGAVSSVGIEALMPNMVYLHVILACLSIVVSPGLFLLPESPRWLTANGHIDKAENVINKIAKINKKPVPKNVKTVLTAISKEGEDSVGDRGSYSVLHVFASRSVLKITSIGGFVMMCNAVVFFAISYGVSDLAGNVFLNILIMSLAAVPGNMSVPFLNNGLGRRLTVFLFFLLTTISQAGCLLVLYATPGGGSELGFLVNAFCVVTILCMESAVLAFAVWSVELYPTVIRNAGYSVQNGLYRLGGVAAPFAVDLADRKRLSFILMTTLMLLSTLFVLVLPETKDKEMTDYTAGSNSSESHEFSESDRLNLRNKHRHYDALETKQLLKFHK